MSASEICPCAVLPDEPFKPAQCSRQDRRWCPHIHYADPEHYEKECPLYRDYFKETVKEIETK